MDNGKIMFHSGDYVFHNHDNEVGRVMEIDLYGFSEDQICVKFFGNNIMKLCQAKNLILLSDAEALIYKLEI